MEKFHDGEMRLCLVNDLKRSGRLKCKGPVIEENSIDEAINVDADLSDEEGSEYSGKILAENTEAGASTSGNKKIEDEKDEKIKKKRKMDNTMGFGKLLHFKVEGIPSKLGFYVVDNFDDKTMEIKMENASLMITMESIADMIGIINKGVDIFAEDVVKDAQMIKNWEDQFVGIKNITANDVKRMIRNSRVADMNFKLNFIVLFTSVMGCVKTNGICDLSVLNHIRMDTDLAKVNWCTYIWRCLKKCKDGWKNTIKQMMYVDGTVCKYFKVGRERPPTTMWTKELLKERELVEIKSGGLGKGELAGPYVEEQDDPMPDNLEGFIWKLNNYVVCINKERCGFERTFAAAKEMFPGNTMFAELEKRFIESLKYQQEESAEIGHASVHTEDETMANEVQDKAIVCETADKLYKESERKKLYDFLDIPSFSLGLTQEEYDMGAETHKEFTNTYEKGVEAFSSRKSDSRVVNIDKVENSEEKWNGYSEKGQKQSQNGQNQARDWKERENSKKDKKSKVEMIGLGYQGNLMARMDFGLLSHKKHTLELTHRSSIKSEDPRN
ncbi:hypothetical protein Tco_1039408 [Tanacetum coccineum]